MTLTVLFGSEAAQVINKELSKFKTLYKHTF